MGAYLCWLAVRVLEMHRILKPTGSLYLHIDHTAHAYAKCMLDAIFGRKNFRNEIVWCYAGGVFPAAISRVSTTQFCDTPRRITTITILSIARTPQVLFSEVEHK